MSACRIGVRPYSSGMRVGLQSSSGLLINLLFSLNHFLFKFRID
jgi:hypothetical protein